MTRTMKPSAILKRARKLIERGWCKGPMATDAEGNEVGPTSREAVCFCAAGALRRIGGYDWEAAEYLDRSRGRFASAVTFADSRTTKPQVLRAFDRAIALALKEGR